MHDSEHLQNYAIDTQIAHGGRNPQAQSGFVNPPIVRGSTVIAPSLYAQRKAYERPQEKSGEPPYLYGRRGNPTTYALESALNQLESAAGTVLTPSGLSAASTALFATLKAGDHLLITDTVYQPTRDFADGMLARFGVEVTYYDPMIGADIRNLFKPNTRVIYTESPGSQTFEIQDIPAIVEAAKAIDALVLMDNTWATPLFFKALDFGVDIAIYAGTKYLIGHSDAMLGTISANERAWPILRRGFDQCGLCAGPDDVYLGLRGLRTLSVRLRQHEQSALKIAHWLDSQSEVSKVLHPALPNTPGHNIWKRDFNGSSGLFSVIMKHGTFDQVAAMIDGFDLFGLGFSWGGYESLVIYTDPGHYRTATTWQAEGPLIRFYIGLEDADDLIMDLQKGLARYSGAV